MRSCVIVVNWNGWKDTIECLESLVRLVGSEIQIIVCDNGSSDGSLDRIKAWADGELLAAAVNPQLRHLISPPTPKPLSYSILSNAEATSGCKRCESRLVLIQTGADLGYAGGNNIGIRYALGDVQCKYFWILNNDTVVDREALSSMISVMDDRADMGMCGSLTLSYHRPTEVQAQGGFYYNIWTGRTDTPAFCTVADVGFHPQRRNYINGASMLVTRRFIEQVGLIDESYFIYFEELDWIMRAKGHFSIGYARDSVIYHKEGASLGSSTDRRKRGLLSEKYVSRNRVLFARRYFPWTLPAVLIAICAAALDRLLRGDWRRARAMLYWAYKGLIGDVNNP